MISSLTESVKPEGKTVYPRSRSANVRSSAISGVSSMSRMRGNRTLLLAGAGARQRLVVASTWRQVQNPPSPASRVVGATFVFDHCAPGFQRTHRESVSLEVLTRVAKHLVRMPVVSEHGVTRMHTQDFVITIISSFGPHVARRPAFLAFADDEAFLRW